MKHRFGKTVILGLGGSIVVPDQINWQLLRRLRRFLLPRLRGGQRFVLAIGGGVLSRNYQAAASKITRLTDEDKDWIGIHATRLNAHLLRTIFYDVADPVVWDHRNKRPKLKYPLTIASGWRPGWSTDYIAVALAADLQVPEVVIAGKPAFVYDKDNTKHKDARPFHELKWREYRKLIPAKWIPGLKSPVDPVGAAYAQKAGIEAIVVNGRDLANLGKLLKGKEFMGTIIS